MKTSFKKLYLFGFALFLMLSLIILYLYFTKINTRYNSILNDELDNLALTQKLTYESINNYFILKDMINEPKIDKLAIMNNQWIRQTERNTTFLDSLAYLNIIKIVSQKNLNYLLDARKDYLEKGNQYLVLILSNDKKSAEKFFNEQVGKSFFKYQDELGNFVYMHRAEVVSYAGKIPSEVNLTKMELILTGKPTLFLYGFILLVLCAAYFIIMYNYLYPKVESVKVEKEEAAKT